MKNISIPLFLVSIAAFAAPVSVSNGVIRIEAKSTGIAPGSICEFPLVSAASGHDYEALFQTSATAAQIDAAVRSTGAPAGVPVDVHSFRFWPKGERFSVSVSVSNAPAVPIGRFLMNSRGGAAPASDGFLYIGGKTDADGESDIDVTGPGSILPNYNEPKTVFDIPRLAAQGDVYEYNRVAESFTFGKGAEAVITIEPEKRDAGLPPRRVRDVAARLSADGISLAGTEDAGALQPVEAVAKLHELREKNKQDVYLSFSWDGDTTFADLKKAAALLAMIDNGDKGVRVDAPPKGFVFYKAFLPNEDWRDRTKRPSQPCELRFADGGTNATVTAVTEKWNDDSLTPEISTEDIADVPPAKLLPVLNANTPDRLNVLLVFVPAQMKWSALAPYLNAVHEKYPLVQIFVD